MVRFISFTSILWGNHKPVAWLQSCANLRRWPHIAISHLAPTVSGKSIKMHSLVISDMDLLVFWIPIKMMVFLSSGLYSVTNYDYSEQYICHEKNVNVKIWNVTRNNIMSYLVYEHYDHQLAFLNNWINE